MVSGSFWPLTQKEFSGSFLWYPCCLSFVLGRWLRQAMRTRPSPLPPQPWLHVAEMSQGWAGCSGRVGRVTRTGIAWHSWHYLKQRMKKAMPRALSKIIESPVAKNQGRRISHNTNRDKRNSRSARKHTGRPVEMDGQISLAKRFHTRPWWSRSSCPSAELHVLKRNQKAYLWATRPFVDCGADCKVPNTADLPQTTRRSNRRGWSTTSDQSLPDH